MIGFGVSLLNAHGNICETAGAIIKDIGQCPMDILFLRHMVDPYACDDQIQIVETARFVLL